MMSQDPRSPLGHLRAGGPSLFLTDHDAILRRFPLVATGPAQARIGRLAAIRLEAIATAPEG